MRVDERVNAMRAEALKAGKPPVAASHKGVTKVRVEQVLKFLGLEQPDILDSVYALLDDTQVSWFPGAPQGALFCDGATTAHVACHVGILQRASSKLDREGRDYWIKPLRDIGAIEACHLAVEQRVFLAGHPIAKSPNNCYRLDADFVKLLQVDDSVLKDWLEDWSNSESTRARLRLQAAIALETASKVHSDHAYLIAACVATYAPRYLPSYRVVYTDTSDGDRVTAKEREALRLAGVSLGLSDPMPDVILWDPPADRFWIIEAVTSDGEVDLQKLAAVRKWAERHSKILAGCTTAYATWKAAAVRQGKHKNLAPGTYLWILEDAGRQYRVQTTTDG